MFSCEIGQCIRNLFYKLKNITILNRNNNGMHHDETVSTCLIFFISSTSYRGKSRVSRLTGTNQKRTGTDRKRTFWVPKRTLMDTETDRDGPERTETDRNGPKRTFVDTETDYLGTETDFIGYRNGLFVTKS